MAVEIEILSGPQQGRRLHFDGKRILVGDATAADVRFEAEGQPLVRGKTAVLTLDDETGWQIENVGSGAWLVNQTSLEPSQTLDLRSEDLVRVSEVGPGLFFRLVTASHAPTLPTTPAPVSLPDEASLLLTYEPIISDPTAELVSVPIEVPLSRRERTGGKVPGTAPGGSAARTGRPPSPGGTAEAPIKAKPPDSSPWSQGGSGTPCPDLPAAPPPKKRRMRETSPLGRFIGIVVSGLLGLLCAYGLAHWLGR